MLSYQARLKSEATRYDRLDSVRISDKHSLCCKTVGALPLFPPQSVSVHFVCDIRLRKKFGILLRAVLREATASSVLVVLVIFSCLLSQYYLANSSPFF